MEKAIEVTAKQILCVFYFTYVHTHTNSWGEEEQGGMGMGSVSWALTGDIIWVSYSGEKAHKPTDGIK